MYNYSREQSSQKCRERQLSFGAFQSARFGGQEAPKISAQQLTRRKSYANEARVAAETTRDLRPAKKNDAMPHFRQISKTSQIDETQMKNSCSCIDCMHI